MIAEDILLKHPGRHTGYMPQVVSISTLTEVDIKSDGYPRLKSIPGKISAYFDRKLIKKAWKSDHARKREDNFYLLLTTDNTIFLIEY